MVLEAGRQQHFRRSDRSGLCEHEEAVFDYRRFDRRVLGFPVRNQLVERTRIHDRAGQDVRADLGTLFEHANAELGILLGGELFQAYAGCKACGPAADDNHVILHGFALHDTSVGCSDT
jgi:hypothetical protein